VGKAQESGMNQNGLETSALGGKTKLNKSLLEKSTLPKNEFGGLRRGQICRSDCERESG